MDRMFLRTLTGEALRSLRTKSSYYETGVVEPPDNN